ncbi:MAG TPA: HutD family protein [Steroidobacteraceae bacterium]|nr:HutD family protein [Steroidobacteraceae bacterium]
MPAHTGPFEVLRAAQRVAVPWKNGGGLTREVAVEPAGSDLERFDWRVSIAEIHAPGPFSRFPGIERRMAALAGMLTVSIAGQPPVCLSPATPPLAFPGEVAACGEPIGGNVTDLNVMTRRERFTSSLARANVTQSGRFEASAPVTLLLALTQLELRCGADAVGLAPLDAVRIAPATRCVIAAGGDAAYYLVAISACPRPGG